MRFDFDAYEKVYPKQDPLPEIDTAVEGFTPTADELSGRKARDNRPGDDPEPELKAPITQSEEAPPEGE